MIPLLGGAGPNNAAPQGALDALSAFGQAGPQMPDFSGAQFGGLNNLGAASATNPFAMSGAAGAAASKLPSFGGAGGAPGKGGMAGLSGSINKLIASNNKLVAALNKVAASMGKGGAGGSMGGVGGDPMGVFEQLNLQKRAGVSGGGTGSQGGGRGGGKGGGGGGGKDGGGDKAEGGIGIGLGMFTAGTALNFADFKIPTPFGDIEVNNPFDKRLKNFGGVMQKVGKNMLGIGSFGKGTTIQGIASSIPFGLGGSIAQNMGVIGERTGEMINLERLAFRTAVSRGESFRGKNATAGVSKTANPNGAAAALGYSPEMAMENLLDVATTGGFRFARDAQERSFSAREIFRFKNVGFGSTVLGGIQELQARGSGARGIFNGPQDLAFFGAGMGRGARGMNKIAEGVRNLGTQANMFGLNDAVRSQMFNEVVGFEASAGVPTSFKGIPNAINRGFMTHQQMMDATTGGIQSMFGSVGQNMSMAFDIRAAREKLGGGATGVQIMREARKMATDRTAQQKVAQMRDAGMSEDVIVARLLGNGLDEDEIQFALSDTGGAGQTAIEKAIASGKGQVGGVRTGATPLSSATAKGQFKRVQETYKGNNTDKLVQLVEANDKLKEQLFANAQAVELNTKAMLKLATFYESSNGDVVTSINDAIKGINDLLKLKNKIPTL